MDQRTATGVSQPKPSRNIVILLTKGVMPVGLARSCSAGELPNSFSKFTYKYTGRNPLWRK